MFKQNIWDKLNIDQKVGLVSLPFLTIFVFLTLAIIQKPTSYTAGARSKKANSCEICLKRCDRFSKPTWTERCKKRCERICPQITPTHTPIPIPTYRQPTPTPIPTRRPSTPTPTAPSRCGNGFCEPGEADEYYCPECKPGDQPCSLRPCYFKPGSCPQDCNNSEQELCLKQGGNWRQFNNSCADKCLDPRIMQLDLACLEVITESCDCGPEMCWNGQSCIKNPLPYFTE